MILKDTELIKMFYIIYQKFYSKKEITIENVNLIIGDSIKVYIELVHNHIQTSINLLTSVEVHKDYLLLKPKGVVRYGFLQFEIIPLLTEYSHKIPFIHILNEEIYIENHYIKELNYHNGQIEISLK